MPPTIHSHTPTQTTHTQSLDSLAAPRSVETATIESHMSAQVASAEVKAATLEQELNRMSLVFGELLSAQDAEILRLRALLDKLGVDGDGNPLPSEEEDCDELECEEMAVQEASAHLATLHTA